MDYTEQEREKRLDKFVEDIREQSELIGMPLPRPNILMMAASINISALMDALCFYKKEVTHQDVFVIGYHFFSENDFVCYFTVYNRDFYILASGQKENELSDIFSYSLGLLGPLTAEYKTKKSLELLFVKEDDKKLGKQFYLTAKEPLNKKTFAPVEDYSIETESITKARNSLEVAVFPKPLYPAAYDLMKEIKLPLKRIAEISGEL